MKTVALIAAVVSMTASLAAHADKTEYAFRWNPASGGPDTAAEAAKKLGIQGGKARKFEVRYLTIKQPADLPQGDYQAVARERIDKDGPEAMYKVRGPESEAARAVLAKSVCPLSGPKLESKFEVDMNWALDEETRKTNPGAPPTPRSAISFSCSVETSARTAFPKSADMSPRPCVNKVRRLRSGDSWKVEEWVLPTGDRIVELSHAVDEGSQAHQRVFQEKVDRLLSTGARPLPDSKTLLGSACSK